MTIVTVAVAMVGLLGISALTIDVVSFYVARSEAQRAADGAALAGANQFVASGFTTGAVSQSQVQTLATNEAIAVGDQNQVGGQNPNVQAGDVTFNFSVAGNPRITVTVKRTAANGNAMPTFFGKVFGINTVDVSATATAEAYNPSNGGPPVAATCMKPWIFPNCDPNNTNPAQQNANCPGTPTPGTFFDPVTGQVSRPGKISDSPPGVVGEFLIVKPGNPQTAPAPSQFYPLALGGTGSATYRSNIEACNAITFSCGKQTVSLETGNMVGPTAQGVDVLIHQPGQDTISISPSGITITGGTSNPNPALIGKTITSSDSIVTVPVYNGGPLCPGKSCGGTVDIIGFIQMFIKDERNPQGTVEAYVINIAGCGSGRGGTSPVTSGGVSPLPVRLVQPS